VGSEPPLIDLDWTVLLQLAQLGVMYVVCRAWWFGPYLRMRDERWRRTEGERRRARELETRARALEAELDARRNRARLRAVEEMAARIADGDRRAAGVLDEARRARDRALDEARARIAAETEHARPRLLAEQAAVARRIVKRLLGREPA